MNTTKKIISSTDFYDTIASAYNGFLEKPDNIKIREIVRNKVTTLVPTGDVLDFGGGTGLDLAWLLTHPYNIYFLEPSKEMRNQARKVTPASQLNRLHIVEKNLDFAEWTPETLPFTNKVDAIVANFAVLNCIEDIELFFKKITLLTKPGSYLFATVLDTRFSLLAKSYSLKKAIYTLFTTTQITSSYNGAGHTTYLHSVSKFKKSAIPDFSLIYAKPLNLASFSLLIFERK